MVRKLINDAARTLTNSDTPLLDARVLMAEAANAENAALLFGDITPEQQQIFEKFIQMRRRGMPVAYILGKKEFMGFTFHVNENTLIPRPDTECLVERVLEQNFIQPKILDLCTGSGCIGISLALMIENSTAVLADISDGALEVAEKNICRHNLSGRASALKTDVLSDEIHGTYDIIVSNPPYIPSSTVPTLEVSQSEPGLALDGGTDGLDFYRVIIKNAASHLNDGGMLALEIGYDQGDAVCTLCREYFDKVSLFKDYGGNDRVVTAFKKAENIMKTEIFHTLPDAAKSIREEVFIKEQGFSSEYDEFDEKALHIVLYDGDLPLGTCRIFESDTRGVYNLGRLAVKKEYRGKGLGRIILSEAEKQAALMGGSRLNLHAQLHAKEFYIKCGFTPFGEVEPEQGCPHIWMKKTLNV